MQHIKTECLEKRVQCFLCLNPFTPGRAIWPMTSTVKDNFSRGLSKKCLNHMDTGEYKMLDNI